MQDEDRFFFNLKNPISYEIRSLSGLVTCTVTGCSKEFDRDFDPIMIHELQADSCSFPLPTTTLAIPSHTTRGTASIVSTPTVASYITSTTASVISTASMVSTPTIPSHTSEGTASMVSTPTIPSRTSEGTASMVSTPTIPSHTTSATAHLISASRASTTLMTSHQTTALTKASPSPTIMDDKQENENMFSLLLILSLPLTLIAIFTMSCAIISWRSRKVTK